MGTREFAAQMRTEIEGMKQQGIAAVYVDNLINYLTAVEQSPEPNPSPADMERYKAELEQHIEGMKHANAASLESFKAVIAAGQNAIRSIILINGGASVAMLAFIGHLARIGSATVPIYANCLLPFVAGTLLGGMVSGGTYLAQFFYSGAKPVHHKIGGWVNTAVVLLGVSAFVAFGIGSWQTYSAFTATPPIGDPAFTNALDASE